MSKNLKWMTTSRVVLACLALVAALAVRGWMSVRRAGSLPGGVPVRDAEDVLRPVPVV